MVVYKEYRLLDQRSLPVSTLGLQIVFRDGAAVTKVGQYDGHLTNSATYDDEDLNGAVYRAY